MGFFNEIDALKDHALEPFQNEPGKRRFVQIVFVLLCAAVGVGVAAGNVANTGIANHFANSIFP